MTWIATILELLKELAKAIPVLDRWFTKTPSEKIEDKKDQVRKDIDKFKDTGRPPS